VIAVLISTDLAERLARCQHDRQHRHDGWPWRCHGGGCSACRRCLFARWWSLFNCWLSGSETSLAIIPIDGGGLFHTIKKLRRALRDVRDRAARHDHCWRGVALAGLLDADRMAMVTLIRHAGIDRTEVWDTLERRWPEVILADRDGTAPSSGLTVKDAAELARRKRGIESLRIIVAPQAVAATSC
jgi:hypothetical protein